MATKQQVMKLTGRLTINEVNQIHDSAKRAAKARSKAQSTLDLSEVDNCDLSVIQIIILLQRSMEEGQPKSVDLHLSKYILDRLSDIGAGQ